MKEERGRDILKVTTIIATDGICIEENVDLWTIGPVNESQARGKVIFAVPALSK